MYTRGEASRIRQEFWTAFGRYLTPILSSEGIQINWINYHTHVKDLFFRMHADNRSASIAISIEQADASIRELYFEQFLELKMLLHGQLGEEWEWLRNTTDESGRPVSRIAKELVNVSIFNKSDWPELIAFFKPRIIALDVFWENARYSFEALR
ncbi:MAG TPA: DUF4268 domain-containing protein [Chryseolinea sp.]|nr:DUF4268 domain-containing protein [Chryseolinea sp.]